MPLTSFGKFIASNPSDFSNSDQIAVGKHFVYIMQNPSSLQYADKRSLALIGNIKITISITDNRMPGMVWWGDKIYLPDNSGNLYYLITDPTNGIPNPSLTKIASLSNFGGIQNQLGFDFGRKLIIYKQTSASIAYYIDPSYPSKTGIYATAAETNFGGSGASSNFFVDGDGFMYVGIGDTANPDIRILKPLGTTIPVTYILDKDLVSNSAGTGGNLCDGLYPDPFDGTVVYTNNDYYTINLYNIVGEISFKNLSPKNLLLSCDNVILLRHYIVLGLVFPSIDLS